MGTTGLNLTEMRALVRKGVGNLTTSELSDSDLDNYLNMAFWELETAFPFKEKECRIEFDTTAAENMYDLPDQDDSIDIEAIQSVSILDDNTPPNTSILTRMTQSWWDTNYTHENTDAHALPRRYVRMDNIIILDPTPDKSTYTVRIYFLKSLLSLLSGTVDEPDLPREWHQILVQKAVAKVHFFNQDYNLAQQAESITVGMIRQAVAVEAKEERDSHYAGLQVVHDEPTGGQGFMPR